ncbi:MAG TPA: hypothetical protein VF041_15645 [Gemmatimonadaceae bacterium]
MRWLPLDDAFYMLASVLATARADPVAITRRALLQVEAHLRGDPDGVGVLVGGPRRYPEAHLSLILVESAARADAPAGVHDVEAEIAAGLGSLARRLELDGRMVVGWYRGNAPVVPRPVLRDVAIHRTHFPHPWQVAILRHDAGGSPQGGIVRVEPGSLRPYCVPFLEIIPANSPAHDDVLPTAITWVNYHPERRVVPLPPSALDDPSLLPIDAPPAPTVVHSLIEWIRRMGGRKGGGAKHGRDAVRPSPAPTGRPPAPPNERTLAPPAPPSATKPLVPSAATIAAEEPMTLPPPRADRPLSPTERPPVPPPPEPPAHAPLAPVVAPRTEPPLVDVAPVDVAPVDAAPVGAAPVGAATVDRAPVDAAPIAAARVDAAPIEAAPDDAPPVEAASADAALDEPSGPAVFGIPLAVEPGRAVTREAAPESPRKVPREPPPRDVPVPIPRAVETPAAAPPAATPPPTPSPPPPSAERAEPAGAPAPFPREVPDSAELRARVARRALEAKRLHARATRARRILLALPLVALAGLGLQRMLASRLERLPSNVASAADDPPAARDAQRARAARDDSARAATSFALSRIDEYGSRLDGALATISDALDAARAPLERDAACARADSAYIDALMSRQAIDIATQQVGGPLDAERAARVTALGKRLDVLQRSLYAGDCAAP